MPNNRFLVDTSVWLFALRKDPIPEIRDRIDALLREDLVITTGIIKLEILAGVRSEKEYKRLEMRLDALDQVETGSDLWRCACEYGFRLRREGLTVPSTDVLIAACAKEEEAVLLHADAHFDLMARPLDLRVESQIPLLRGIMRG
jgi:predicted nucleic acid-binding protein